MEENRDTKSISNEDRKRYPGKPPSNTTNSMVDMIMGSGSGGTDNSGEQKQATVDAETLVAQTQDRMSSEKALSVRCKFEACSGVPPESHKFKDSYVRRFSGLNHNEHDFARRQSSHVETFVVNDTFPY